MNTTAKQKEKGKILNSFTCIELFLKDRSIKLKRNVVSMELEQDGEELSEQEVNSIYIKLSKELTKKEMKKVSKEDFFTYICSNEIESYNPLHEYFNSCNKGERGNIDKLVDSLELNQEQGIPKELVKMFITKWLVGMVAGIYDSNYSPLFLVLIGGKGIGKTEFFRRLLPDRLKKYRVESELDETKRDEEARACKNIMLFVDEMDCLTENKSADTLRRFSSKQELTFRPPFARKDVKRKRLAALCGTSNESSIIKDRKNNRRVVPIEISSINWKAFNDIDKDSLFGEVYNLYKGGYDWNLSREEMTQLDIYTQGNAIREQEEELLTKYFIPTKESGTFLTTTDVAVKLRNVTGFRISTKKLGKALKDSGFTKASKRVKGSPVYGWWAELKVDSQNGVVPKIYEALA